MGAAQDGTGSDHKTRAAFPESHRWCVFDQISPHTKVQLFTARGLVRRASGALQLSKFLGAMRAENWSISDHLWLSGSAAHIF